MFLPITHIDDLRPHVADKKEINFRQNGDITLAVYVFSDKDTLTTTGRVSAVVLRLTPQVG